MGTLAILITSWASLATRCHGDSHAWMRWIALLTMLMALVERVTSASGTIRVSQYEDVIFMCDTPDKSRLTPHYVVWHRGQLAMKQLDDRFYVNPGTGSLTISDVKIEDEGNYTCSAGWGQRFEPYTVNLLVLIAPRIRVTSENPVRPHVLETLTVSCKATGRPPPSILWYSSKEIHINSSLTEPGSRFSIQLRQSESSSVESFLVISPVFAEDRGTFACRATNVVSSAMDNVVVDVQQKPVMLSPSQNIFVYWWEGHKVNLTCQSVGNPAPVILWTALDEASSVRQSVLSPVVDVKNGIVVTSNLWLPSSRTFSLPATYKCMARNPYGITPDRRFVVKEGVAPRAPVVNILRIKDDEVVLSINIYVTEDTPPVTYVSALYRLEEGTRDMDMGTAFSGNGTRLMLRGIMLYYRYIIRVRVFNMVGPSQETLIRMYSEERIFTTPPPMTSEETDNVMDDITSEDDDNNDDSDVTMSSDDKTRLDTGSSQATNEGRALESADGPGNDAPRFSFRCSVLVSILLLVCALRKSLL